jgi:heat shock protein HslJ
MRIVPLVVLLGVLAASCGDNPLRPSDLKEVTWKLERIDRAGVPTITVATPEQYTLRLGNDGRLGVRADCNQCSGTYSLEGDTLKIGNMACTLVSCPSGSLDSAYGAALGGSSTIAISNSQLILQNGGVTLRFRN